MAWLPAEIARLSAPRQGHGYDSSGNGEQRPVYERQYLLDSHLSQDFPRVKNKVAWIDVCDLTEPNFIFPCPIFSQTDFLAFQR